MSLYVGIEAGGTKFVCAMGSSPDDISQRKRFETRSPKETMPEVIAYIKAMASAQDIKAIGLACFGPLELRQHSPAYGSITSTPKKAWRHYNIVAALKAEFDLPIGFNTDCNTAALGEARWGAGKGLSDVLYITVGTGIGIGVISGGNLVRGAMHPEGGHILVPHDKAADPFAGVCIYHGDCLEGLACGPAIKERWNVASALDLEDDHPAWDLEAHYLAMGLKNYTLTLSPQKIIMGGGVMRHDGLLENIREKVIKYISGYVKNEALDDVGNYIVAAALGDNAGLGGALALAEQAYKDKRS